MAETPPSPTPKYGNRALTIVNNFHAAATALADSPRKTMYQLAMLYLFQIASSVDSLSSNTTPEVSGRGIPKIKFLRFNHLILNRLKNDIVNDLQQQNEEEEEVGIIEEAAKEFVALEQEIAPEVERLLREAPEGTEIVTSEPYFW